MVGERFFSQSPSGQGFAKRSYPDNGPASQEPDDRDPANELNTGDGLTEKGKSQMGRVQTTRPAPTVEESVIDQGP